MPSSMPALLKGTADGNRFVIKMNEVQRITKEQNRALILEGVLLAISG
jgi:hypothetical protein